MIVSAIFKPQCFVNSAAALLTLVAMFCVAALPAAADESFREFPDEDVQTPAELFQTLSWVWADELRQLLNDRFQLSEQEFERAWADIYGPPPTRPGVNPIPSQSPATPDHVDRPSHVQDPFKRLLDDLNRLSNSADSPPATRGANSSDGSSNTQSQTATPSIADRLFRRPTEPTDESDEPRQSNSEFRRTLRDEFNRLLFDAAQETVTEASENPASASAIQSLFRDVAQATQETMGKDDGSFRRAVLGALSDAKTSVRRSEQGFSESRGSGLADYDASYLDGNTPLIWGALGLFASAVALFLFRRRLVSSFSKYSEKIAARARMRVQLIRSRHDLVEAFDRVLLWVLGPQASWWSGREIERELVTNDPDLALHISELVADYEVARYAPQSHTIPMARLTRCAQTLSHLATTYYAREQSSANEHDDATK